MGRGILATIFLVGFIVSFSHAAEITLSANCHSFQQEKDDLTTCDVKASDIVGFNNIEVSSGGTKIESVFQKFDINKNFSAWLFLIDTSNTGGSARNQALVRNMADTVRSVANGNAKNRHVGVAAFAEKLTMLAQIGSSSEKIDSALKSIKPKISRTELYRVSELAIDQLKKTAADRKALVLLTDGKAEDSQWTRESVVKAALENDVTIITVAYAGDASARGHWQNLRLLARDSGGNYIEAEDDRLPKTMSDTFFGLLENGGRVTFNSPAAKGDTPISINASFFNGGRASLQKTLSFSDPGFLETMKKQVRRLTDNKLVLLSVVLAIVLGSLSYMLFNRSRMKAAGDSVDETVVHRAGDALSTARVAENSRVLGWFEFLDGNATRLPIKGTNIRIGRHRDNDIRLNNKTISRNHAVLHFNPHSENFTITDLNSANGIFVNEKKCEKQEIRDGDLVEIGEVRLRYYAA